MEFRAKVYKEGRFWLAEVPFLDVMTQAHSRSQAVANAVEAVELLLDVTYGDGAAKSAEVYFSPAEKGVFGIGAKDDTRLLSLGLLRQRQLSGSTVREASLRLGTKHPNAYAQYERGKRRPSIAKYEELLHAANPKRKTLRIS